MTSFKPCAILCVLVLAGAAGATAAGERSTVPGAISSCALEEMGLRGMTLLCDAEAMAIRGTGKGYGIGPQVSEAAKSGKHGQELADYVHSLNTARKASKQKPHKK